MLTQPTLDKLQALKFTGMATALAERLKREAGDDVADQVNLACRICYSRSTTKDEMAACREMIRQHGLAAMCRVLLNTSEMIYVR